jgi:hypothetical protein
MMEKVMSQTNETSKPAALEDHRPLADRELASVSGGIGIQREPTYHPAKVTAPDIKLSLS